MLSESDKRIIRVEEVFREEVRASLSSERTSGWIERIWKILNSSFIIFLLSTVVLGIITQQFQRRAENQTKLSERAFLRNDATLELKYRFYMMRETLKESTAKGRDGQYVIAVFFGHEPFAPATSRFKDVSVPAVLYLLKNEKLNDLFEKLIADVMPEMSVAVQKLGAFGDKEPLDPELREQILDSLTKIQMMSIRW